MSNGCTTTWPGMGRWLQWQMKGRSDILRPELLAQMQTPPANATYAMGWFRQTTTGRTTIWHDGVFTTVYSNIAILPERNLDIVLLYGGGGALPAATTFPIVRAGVLAVTNGDEPERPGLSLVTIGRRVGAVTLILIVAALVDVAVLLRWTRWARAAPT